MEMDSHKKHGMYQRLLVMAILSFGVMYLFMYSMVNVWSNVIPNYNQFYMAGLMASPMIILELVLMGPMYGNKRRNAVIIVISIVLLGLFWIGIRSQLAINDEQFLKSMIPHHAGAILMCENADIKDVEVQKLCRNIISGQQAEINFMKVKLNSIK